MRAYVRACVRACVRVCEQCPSRFPKPDLLLQGDHVGLPCDMLKKQCKGELKHTCLPPFWIEFGANPLSSILRCMYGFLASSFSGAPACSMLFPKTCIEFPAQVELGTLITAPT